MPAPPAQEPPALPPVALAANDASTTKAMDARAVLAEMARIEQQLDAARREQAADRRALETTSATLGTLQQGLREREALRATGEDDLRAARQTAERAAAELEARIRQARERHALAQDHLRRDAALALQRVRDPRQPARQRAAALLLAQAAQIEAAATTREGLEAEAELADLRGGTVRLAEAGQYYSSFSELGASQLRARHAELASRLNALNEEVQHGTETEQSLESQAQGLRSLLAQLAQQAATPPAAETADTSATEQATPTPTPVEPQAPRTSEPMLTETRGDAGQPQPTGDSDSSTHEGTRRLFWRATPVVLHAPLAGRVLFAQPFAGYRHLLILDHGGGWRTLYGNLSVARVTVGQDVSAGTELGDYQAAQGPRAEPLWFEVRKGTTAIPPENWEQLPAGWESGLFSAGAASAR